MANTCYLFWDFNRVEIPTVRKRFFSYACHAVWNHDRGKIGAKVKKITLYGTQIIRQLYRSQSFTVPERSKTYTCYIIGNFNRGNTDAAECSCANAGNSLILFCSFVTLYNHCVNSK